MNAAARRTFPLRLALVAGGLGAGLLAAPALAGLVLAPRTGAGRPPAFDPADPGAGRFLAGLDAARDGRWDEAREHLAAAVTAGVPEAPERLATVERKLAVDAAAARARALLADGDPAGAAVALAEAGRGGPELGALGGEVRAAARKRLEELSSAAGRAGEGDESRAAFADLAASFPEEARAVEAAARPRAPQGDPAADRALAALRAGGLAEARAAVVGCRLARCRSIARSLEVVAVGLASPAGGAADGGPEGRSGLDVPALEAAWAALQRLGGSAPLEKTVGAKLAPWYHDAGLEALRRGDLGTARERFDRALGVWPGHPPSQRERERLRARARELFLEGYTEKDASPDQARQKFRLVATISGPEEELHRKARRWLERLDGEAGSRAEAPRTPGGRR